MPNSRTLLRSSLLALSFALPFGLASVAHAAGCGDGPACPKNYECKTEQVPCLAKPCDGGDCAPVDCDASTYSYCAPLPCTADAQCDDGMVCYTATRQECESVDCGPKGSDDAGEPGDAGAEPDADTGDNCEEDALCEDVTESGCVPKYALPCAADADCGLGFTCEAEEECQCSGSGGSAGSGSSGSGGTPAPDAGSDDADPAPPAKDGGAAPNPAPDAGASDCSCQPSERKSCSLKVVACSVDEGCPIGWTCGNNPNGVCSGSSDGSSSCSADPAKICLPPYSDVLGRGGIAEDGGDTTGSGTGVKGDGEPPVRGDDGEQAPHDASSGSSADNAADSSDSGGCAIGHAPNRVPATLGFAALALIGLLGARRRIR